MRPRRTRRPLKMESGTALVAGASTDVLQTLFTRKEQEGGRQEGQEGGKGERPKEGQGQGPALHPSLRPRCRRVAIEYGVIQANPVSFHVLRVKAKEKEKEKEKSKDKAKEKEKEKSKTKKSEEAKDRGAPSVTFWLRGELITIIIHTYIHTYKGIPYVTQGILPDHGCSSV